MANQRASTTSTPWHTDRWFWTLVNTVVKR
jgi:hypothetical protein